MGLKTKSSLSSLLSTTLFLAFTSPFLDACCCLCELSGLLGGFETGFGGGDLSGGDLIGGDLIGIPDLICFCFLCFFSKAFLDLSGDNKPCSIILQTRLCCHLVDKRETNGANPTFRRQFKYLVHSIRKFGRVSQKRGIRSFPRSDVDKRTSLLSPFNSNLQTEEAFSTSVLYVAYQQEAEVDFPLKESNPRYFPSSVSWLVSFHNV